MVQTLPIDPVRQETIIFLLTPGFSMMSLASAVEPLRSLNRLAGRDVYQWKLASLDGGQIEPSNGIWLETERLEKAIISADRLFICAGIGVGDLKLKPYLAALRKVSRSGIPIGSVSTGTFLLARAGLLEGKRCTVHWESRPAFIEQFPNINCTNRLYEIDGPVMTCSGGTAALDMMLHLIASTHGHALADGVANQFHHERIRSVGESQRGGSLGFINPLPQPVQKAVSIMQKNIEVPLPLPVIAEKIGVSARQLERLMSKHMGSAPAKLYMQFRIERARELLMYSNVPITDIAVQVGFSSPSHFTTWFKRIFGTRPSDVRNGVLARLQEQPKGRK